MPTQAQREPKGNRAARLPGKRKVFWWAGLLTMLGAALAFFMVRHPQQRRDVEPATETALVTRGSLEVQVLESGRVEAGQQAQIRSRVGGVVTEVLVDEGQRVSAGDLLLRLDPAEYQRDVSRAEADVIEARSQLRLARWRHRTNVRGQRGGVIAREVVLTSANELTLAGARLKSTLARLRSAQDQVRHTNVSAPFAGRILQRNVQPGELVVPGMTATIEGHPLLVLASDEELVVRVELNQIDFARARLDQSVTITFDNAPGSSFIGKVVSLAASSTLGASGTDVLPIKVRFESGQDLSMITPGMVADVDIDVIRKVDVLVVPIEAVAFSHHRKRVHVWSDSTMSFALRPVETGDHDDRHIEILEGLVEGDRVALGLSVPEGTGG